MSGLVFGLLYQLVVALGFVWVAGLAPQASPVLKANLMLCSAGVAAVVAISAFALIQQASFASITRSELIQLAAGSLLILVVGESLYILGISASNATTMAYTALAYPGVTLVLEIAFRRRALSSFSLRELLGFGLLACGFIALLPKR